MVLRMGLTLRREPTENNWGEHATYLRVKIEDHTKIPYPRQEGNRSGNFFAGRLMMSLQIGAAFRIDPYLYCSQRRTEPTVSGIPVDVVFPVISIPQCLEKWVETPTGQTKGESQNLCPRYRNFRSFWGKSRRDGKLLSHRTRSHHRMPSQWDHQIKEFSAWRKDAKINPCKAKDFGPRRQVLTSMPSSMWESESMMRIWRRLWLVTVNSAVDEWIQKQENYQRPMGKCFVVAKKCLKFESCNAAFWSDVGDLGHVYWCGRTASWLAVAFFLKYSLTQTKLSRGDTNIFRLLG
jgi:hypothetical protein